MPRPLAGALDAFDRLFMLLAQISLGVMMLTISLDSLGRYLFGRPLPGAYEFTSLYLMVVLTFLAMPAVYARGGHIRLDVLRARLARIPGNPSERINAALAAGVFGLLAWHAGGEAIEKFARRDTTFGIIRFPVYWSYVWVPLGAGLLALRLALEVIWPRRPEAGAP